MASSSKSYDDDAEEWEDEERCVEQPKKRVFKTYTDYLAAPNPRRMYSEPKVKDLRVPRAALHAKASKRIKRLALPRSLPTSLHSWEGGPSIEPAALKYKITERLNELAIPSPRLLEVLLKDYGHQMTNSQREILEEKLREGEELARRIRDKYLPRDDPRYLSRGPSSTALRSKTSRGDVRSTFGTEADYQRLEVLARPAYHPPPVAVKRGKKVPLPMLMKRIKVLSKPTPRDPGAHRAKEWKFTPEMKNYKASDRINQISKPIMRPNIHVNFEPQVSEAAKHFQATERLKILAIPKRKAQEPDTELRENPFQVSPLALQARCTQRLKELSQPVKRDTKK